MECTYTYVCVCVCGGVHCKHRHAATVATLCKILCTPSYNVLTCQTILLWCMFAAQVHNRDVPEHNSHLLSRTVLRWRCVSYWHCQEQHYRYYRCMLQAHSSECTLHLMCTVPWCACVLHCCSTKKYAQCSCMLC